MGTTINTTLLLTLSTVAGANADVYDDVYAHMDTAPMLAVNNVSRVTTRSLHTSKSVVNPHPPMQPTFASPPFRDEIESVRIPEQEPSPREQSTGDLFGLQGIRAHILYAAKYSSLPPALIHAVIATESRFDPNARSPAGALGLMQLMPRTAHMLGVDNPFDPRQNVLGGSRYLRQLLDQFGGKLALALAAYNAGPATVLRYGGIPPYAETTRYVSRVRNRFHAASALYSDWKDTAP